MKLQRMLKEFPRNPEAMEPFASWQELSPKFEERVFGDCLILLASLEDSQFDRLVGIFQSREEAMGAFLTVAMEHGWEEVPETYCVYHAQEIDGRLVAGIMFDGSIETYEQNTVEKMVQVMAGVHRVVVYSSDVVTYIKDLYPEVDKKAFVIVRELSKRLLRAPELEELAKIYGMPCESLEDKLRLIGRLLENPVRTPFGEVELPPFSHPLGDCS